MSDTETQTPEKKTKRKSREKKTTDLPLRKSPRLASRENPSPEAESEPKSSKRKTTKKEEESEGTSSAKQSPAEKSSPQSKDADVEKKDMSDTYEVGEQETTDETKEDETSEMSETAWEKAKSVHDFTVRDIKGEEVSLEKYKGFVLLIVNVASKCGLTSSNYDQLVKLDEQFRDKGLRILAFPCNQFGKQEPGSANDICEFVKKKNVNFDIFEKIEVNGKNSHPLYKYLKKQQPGTFGDFIKWNFSKFIVDKEGKPVERHPPTAAPESLIPNIEKYL